MHEKEGCNMMLTEADKHTVLNGQLMAMPFDTADDYNRRLKVCRSKSLKVKIDTLKQLGLKNPEEFFSAHGWGSLLERFFNEDDASGSPAHG
jgi:hypothetical protein